MNILYRFIKGQTHFSNACEPFGAGPGRALQPGWAGGLASATAIVIAFLFGKL